MKTVSSAKNYIYNLSYKIFSLLTPLITAPYLARVIGTEGVGVISYTYSIAFNFSLIAKLGLMSYGSRCVAKARDDAAQLEKAFSEIYFLQLSTTAFATIAYFVFIFFFSIELRPFLLINSLFVIGIALDIDWFYYGIEDFRSISIRNAIIKALTVVAVLCFVNKKDDLYKYAIIMALGEVIKFASIWVGIKEKTRIRKVQIKQVFERVKPTLILFVPIIATSVYRTMDKIMLGSLSTMDQTGIYEYSEKIIYMLLGFITALENVMAPKVSNLVARGEDDAVLRNISSTMVFVAFLASAMAFGIIGISEKFIPWFYGEDFLGCIQLIPGLAITLLFIGWANVIRTQYIVPYERDHIYVISTIIGAIVNLVINFIFIPQMGANGAVAGTVCAELCVAIYLSFIVRKKLPLGKYFKSTVAFPIIGFFMAVLVHMIGNHISMLLPAIIIEIVTGAVFYLSVSGVYYRIAEPDAFLCIKKRIAKRISKVNDYS